MDTAAKLHPCEWRETTLGDVVEFKNGINFTKGQKGENGTPTVDVRNMYGPGVAVDLRNLYRVSKQIGADHLLKPNDLLFVRSSLKLEGVGWTSMFAGSSEPVSFCGFIIRARPKDGLPLDPLFLTYFCRSDAARRQLIAGSGKVAITNISQDVLAKLRISLPPLPEQQKIAAVLGLVQQAIEQQERLIALTIELKKALLHKLFTEGPRGEPQKQTEIGHVPASWEIKEIQELGLDIGDGNYSTKYPKKDDFTTKGVPFIRANNLVDGRLVWDDMRYISLELHGELTKGHLKKNDVCLVTRGNIGQIAFVTDDFVGANMNAQLVRLNGGDAIDGKFLYYVLSHSASQRQLRSLQTGTALQQLPLGKLKFVRLPLPAHDEQIEIANTLWLVDVKCDIVLRKHEAFETLFRTLLHKLMTAQIRVNDVDLSELPALSATLTA